MSNARWRQRRVFAAAALLVLGTAATAQPNQKLMQALGYALQVAGATPEGLQMPASDAMTPITYAGMSTRQVNFERCREILHEFLDNSFVVVDD